MIVNTVGAAGAAFPQTSIVGGSLFNSANPLSLNQMPDIIGKAAWDPVIADRTIHMEAFGIFRQFNDRIIYPFGNCRVPIRHSLSKPQQSNRWRRGRRLDPRADCSKGAGGAILRHDGAGYRPLCASQLPDVTFNSDGSLAPIQETMLLAGLTWHAIPGLDFYTYAGQEAQNPKFGFSVPGAHTAFGWGNPTFVNTGCDIEFFGTGTGASACSGNTSLVRQITAGFWDTIYKGPFGRLAGGLQYSFTQRWGFAGIGGTPERNENIFFTSLRYYPF